MQKLNYWLCLELSGSRVDTVVRQESVLSVQQWVLRLFLCTISIIQSLFSAHAQTFNLEGTVLDESLKPLEYASIAVLIPSDSTLAYFSLSNSSGQFEMKDIKIGKYLLQCSFLGYRTLYRSISLPGTDSNLGVLLMKVNVQDLNAADISAERIPLRIKKDTIEYDAGAFKTRQDAPVEELLKKMPGIEVDRSGNIKAQGEEVRNVLVDGKEFFGSDTKLATKNLPADAVDKVQVYDKKSEESEMTGIDDGIRSKTINLLMKEDKKSAWLGEIQGAIGTDQHYQSAVKAYRFTKASQFAILGMMNNINQFGFSFQDYIDFNGGIRSMMGESGDFRIQLQDDNSFPVNFGQTISGLITSGAGGLNYSYEKNKENRIFLSYLGNGTDKKSVENTISRNFVENNSFNQDDDLEERTRNYNHRVNAGVRKKIGKNQNLLVNGSASAVEGSLQGKLLSVSSMNDSTINSFQSRNENSSNGIFANANASYLIKWTGKWKLMKISGDLAANRNLQNYEWSNLTEYTQTQQVNAENRFLEESGSRVNYSLATSFSRSIGAFSFLIPAVRAGTKNENLEKVQGIPPGESHLIDSLSADLYTDYKWIRPSLTFKRNLEKSRLSVSAQLESGIRNSEYQNESREDQRINYFLPQFSWELDYRKGRSFRSSYSSDVNLPDAWQLYPVVNNSNSVEQTRGNRELKAEYVHAFQLHWMLFDQFSFTSLFTGISAKYTMNKINWSRTVDENLNQQLKLVNVSSDYTANANIEFSTPVRKLKLNISLNLEERWNRAINFVNYVENINTNFMHSASVEFSNRKQEKWEINAGMGIQVNEAYYSVNKEMNNNYFSYSYFTDLLFKPNERWNLNFVAEVTQYRAQTEKGSLSVPLLRASVNRFITRSGRIVLGLEVFDILNENTGIERVSELNYIQQRQSNTIGRYLMFSVKYRLNKFRDTGSDKVDVQIK